MCTAEVLCHELHTLCRDRISLNTLANESTFKLLDVVLQQGINLQEVCACMVQTCHSSLPSYLAMQCISHAYDNRCLLTLLEMQQNGKLD